MKDPLLWDRRRPGASRAWRNPWIMTALGAAFGIFGLVIAVLGILGLTGSDGASVVALVFGLVFAGLGAVFVVLHGRRIPWWMRARAAVRASGHPMPTDLQVLE